MMAIIATLNWAQQQGVGLPPQTEARGCGQIAHHARRDLTAPLGVASRVQHTMLLAWTMGAGGGGVQGEGGKLDFETHQSIGLGRLVEIPSLN